MPEKIPAKTKSPEELQREEIKKMDENEFEEWLFGNKEDMEYIDVTSEEAGPEESEEKEASPETAETEKSPDNKTPFERHWDEGVKSLKDRYLGVEIAPEAKEEAENILDKEEEAAKLEFVKKWIEDNKTKLEKDHPVTKDMDEEKLITFALTELSPEENPLNRLENDGETQKKYADRLEEMQNLYVLREGIKKSPLNLEAQFLALNHFYEKAKNTSRELNEMQKNPDSKPEEIERKKEEWFKESRIVKELTEKFTGKNPKEEAEKKVEASVGKEKEAFMADRMGRLDRIKAKRHNQILEAFLTEKDLENAVAGTPIAGKEKTKRTIDTTKDFRLNSKVGELTRDQVLAIVGTYGVEGLRDIKHKRFSDKILIGGQEIASGDLDNFLANKKMILDEKIKQELQDTAELQWKNKNKQDVEKKFDEIIKDVASSEGAEGLIKERYASVKQKMYEQWQKEAKIAEAKAKKAESKEKPEEAGKEKSKNADSALSVLELGSKKPEEISRYLRDHGDDFCNLLQTAGMNIDKSYLKKFTEKPKNRKALSFFIKRFLEFMSDNVTNNAA